MDRPLSIIILSNDDSVSLRNTLPALLSQDYGPGYEVIVVRETRRGDVRDMLKPLMEERMAWQKEGDMQCHNWPQHRNKGRQRYRLCQDTKENSVWLYIATQKARLTVRWQESPIRPSGQGRNRGGKRQGLTGNMPHALSAPRPHPRRGHAYNPPDQPCLSL